MSNYVTKLAQEFIKKYGKVIKKMREDCKKDDVKLIVIYQHEPTGECRNL